MDNLTHTLLGVAMSRAGLNRKVPHATLTLVVAANLPDIDIISGFWGNLTYLKYHRGITHSIVGVVGLAFLFALGVYHFEKRWRRPSSSGTSPASLLSIFLVCLAGTSSHLLLDFTNTYGVRAFLPFSGRWVAWDIVSIVDPLLLIFLILGLFLPYLFKMISEEVGTREKHPGQGSAIAALVLIVMLWLIRDVNHRSALTKLSAFTFRGQDPSAVYALPLPGNPFRWHGIAETPPAYYSLEVSPGFSALSLNQARAHYKPEENEAIRVARETPAGKTFLEFSRLPVYTLMKNGDETVVKIHDLRFVWSLRRRGGFVTTIRLSKDFQVLDQRFSFSG